jgi:mannose-6-phosphate isomerase-like protein (cupin superfamily)
MIGYVKDIVGVAKQNKNFRQVIETGELSQIVVMSIPPGGEIGMEVHNGTDQVIHIVDGQGNAILAGEEQPIEAGDVVLVRQGTQHNFVNAGSADLKIITVYAPPHHAPGTIHATKADADAAEAAEKAGPTSA